MLTPVFTDFQSPGDSVS